MADQDDVTEVTDEVIVAPEGDDEQQAPQLTEVEELAAEMGWTPKDQWKGDEADWKPAKDFVKATKDINRNLSRDMRDLRKQMDGISRTTSAMTERAIAAERERWEAELDRATDEGDRSAVRKATDELNKLEKVKPAPDTPPEAQDFASRHSSWFNKDQEATAYAIQRAGHYAEQGLSAARQLKAVEKDMRELFPELFSDDAGKPNPKPPPAVGTPARTARPAPREKGYATLPPEARKACDKWVEQNKSRGAWATKDTWAKSYYEDQEAANG